MSDPAADGDLPRRAADATADPVWALDASFRLLYLNRAAMELLSVDPAQVLGRDLREVFPDVRGSDREELMLRVLSGGEPETLTIQHPRLGGWVELRVQPDPVGVLVVARNIERQVELHRRERMERAILASVGEGIYGVDADNRVTFLNAAAERLLGWDADRVIGRNSHDLLHHTRVDGSAYPEVECPLRHTLSHGDTYVGQDHLWRSDGSALPVEYHSAPIEEEGTVVGAVVTFLDLTDRMTARRAQTEAAVALNALHELQQALQPPPPTTDDPRLGVSYLPADVAGAGGDLYDWQALPDDGLHLTVVDVVGKGLIAARDALAVTHALRLLVLAKTPLNLVVRQASWLLSDAYPDLAATAIVAHYSRATGRLAFVSAGHPPPLLLRPDGTHAYLEASGRPLGWPDAGTDGVVEVEVPRGGRVIFYTDGLIEAGRDITRGMHVLLDHAIQARDLAPADAAHRLVLDILATAERRDDCLALVLDRAE